MGTPPKEGNTDVIFILEISEVTSPPLEVAESRGGFINNTKFTP